MFSNFIDYRRTLPTSVNETIESYLLSLMVAIVPAFNNTLSYPTLEKEEVGSLSKFRLSFPYSICYLATSACHWIATQGSVDSSAS